MITALSSSRAASMRRPRFGESARAPVTTRNGVPPARTRGRGLPAGSARGRPRRTLRPHALASRGPRARLARSIWRTQCRRATARRNRSARIARARAHSRRETKWCGASAATGPGLSGEPRASRAPSVTTAQAMKNRISQTAKSSCFLNSDTACDLFLRAHEDGSKEEDDRHYRRSVPINLYMKGVILILRRRCGPLGPAPDRRPIHFRNGVGRLAGGSGRNAARYGRPLAHRRGDAPDRVRAESPMAESPRRRALGLRHRPALLTV
jgi:hypothetical protein